MSKCGKNEKVSHEAQPSVSLMFLPHFDVLCDLIRERKRPRRRRQQELHKFAYLTEKNNDFARFARAFFIFSHLVYVHVLSTT